MYIYICMYVCMYVCICIYMYHTYIHTYVYIDIHIYVRNECPRELARAQRERTNLLCSAPYAEREKRVPSRVRAQHSTSQGEQGQLNGTAAGKSCICWCAA